MDKAGGHSHIRPVDPRRATVKTRKLFARIKAKSLLVPNLFRVLAHAPAALEGFMNLSEALAGGSFDEKTREKISLTVAESASRTLFRKSLVQASWIVGQNDDQETLEGGIGIATDFLRRHVDERYEYRERKKRRMLCWAA